MSRRTSEASKAIRIAWIREQELVSEGKGTRDWTPEQQKEILEFGKAYYHSDNPDDINDGKAFEGHHMKSAEAYPEYQGDPENIQFLSRSEHQEAHGGDYRNPTNGYYDPVARITRDFGDNKYEPCEVIELSEPIWCISGTSQELIKDKNSVPNEEQKESPSQEHYTDSHHPKEIDIHRAMVDAPSPKGSRSFKEKIMGVVDVVEDFSERHPILTNMIKDIVGITVVAAGTEVIAKGTRRSSRGSSSSLEDYFNSSSDDDYGDYSSSNDFDDLSFSRDYPDERSSPEEHMVSAHGQHYHTREGVIWKEKEPYHRGGKHDD